MPLLLQGFINEPKWLINTFLQWNAIETGIKYNTKENILKTLLEMKMHNAFQNNVFFLQYAQNYFFSPCQLKKCFRNALKIFHFCTVLGRFLCVKFLVVFQLPSCRNFLRNYETCPLHLCACIHLTILMSTNENNND